MNSKLWIGIVAALGAVGCASTPQPNAALESARSIVQTTEADPNVARYAALDLESAKQELQIAEAAALRHDDAAIAQPAYLAAQTGRLAQLKASAKADDARVAAGQSERDNIQLASRNREIDMANQQTDIAKLARDRAASKALSLQAEVDALKAKPTDRGLVLSLGDVLFDTGKSELNPGAGRKLDRLVQFLVEHPDRRVEIDGFTDNAEMGANSLELSQRRADAVRFALQGRGIDATRISSQGYGAAFPVASNVDAGSRQLNRRVEVVIGGENGAAIAARR